MQQLVLSNTVCRKYSHPPTTLQSASMLWESLHKTWPHGCNPMHEVSTSTETRTIMRELGSPAGGQRQTRGMLPFLHCYRACHSDSESSSPCQLKSIPRVLKRLLPPESSFTTALLHHLPLAMALPPTKYARGSAAEHSETIIDASGLATEHS